MKKEILLLLFVISSITILNTKESIKIDVHALCSDSKKEEFIIKISSNKLNLSQDAIQDNTGGYVDIPEDSYYLKTNTDIYYLDGVVEYSNKDNINQLTSNISIDSKRFINTKELYSLSNTQDLKLIQKIKLENNSNINNLKTTTTNIIDIYFDDTQLDKEYQKCKEEIKKSKIYIYPQALLVIFLILGTLYLLKRYLRN